MKTVTISFLAAAVLLLLQVRLLKLSAPERTSAFILKPNFFPKICGAERFKSVPDNNSCRRPTKKKRRVGWY